MDIQKYKFSFQNVFAFVIFGCVFYYFIVNPDATVNETYKNILLIITGFVFGSSKSSVAKDTKIDELQKTATALALTTATAQPTTAEVINTENISGNVTADTVNTTETN